MYASTSAQVGSEPQSTGRSGCAGRLLLDWFSLKHTDRLLTVVPVLFRPTTSSSEMMYGGAAAFIALARASACSCESGAAANIGRQKTGLSVFSKDACILSRAQPERQAFSELGQGMGRFEEANTMLEMCIVAVAARKERSLHTLGNCLHPLHQPEALASVTVNVVFMTMMGCSTKSPLNVWRSYVAYMSDGGPSFHLPA